MTPFDWKLAFIRWVYGALIPAAPILTSGAATGHVDWRLTGIGALSGAVAAAVVDIHAYLNSQEPK